MNDEMLELYQFEGCPFCRNVRKKLDELGLDFVVRTIDPDNRERVEEVSGQQEVPVLVDGEEVIKDSEKIINYLEENY